MKQNYQTTKKPEKSRFITLTFILVEGTELGPVHEKTTKIKNSVSAHSNPN